MDSTKYIEFNWEDFLTDSSRVKVDAGVEVCARNPLLFEKLIPLMVQEINPVSIRASRVICNSIENYPDLFEKYTDHILRILQAIHNESIKFNLLKIFTVCDLPNQDEKLGKLSQICFDSLEMRVERVAVKVYAIDILYRISLIIPELQPELLLTIEKYSIGASAGFLSRANKITKKLNQIKF